MYGRGSPVRSQFSPPIVASFVGRDTWTSSGLGIIYDTIKLLNRNPHSSLYSVVNELVGEAHLATLQALNKLNFLAIAPSAPPIEQPPQLGFDASSSSNCLKQSNKKFYNYCKHSGHTIEIFYCLNKSTTIVTNTKST